MPVTFTEGSTATFPQPLAGGRMTFIDADGDGDLDILYQTGADNTAWQYARSNGDGTYTILSQAASPFAGLALPNHNGGNYHVGDIDGDGDMDLWAGVNGANGSYFSNNGNGTFTSLAATTFPAPAAASRAVMADFDQDGDADILYQTGANGTGFQYARSNGDGTYTVMSQASSPFAGLSLTDNLGGTYYAGDFDGDGDIDIWAAAASTTGSYYVNNGNGTFSAGNSSTFPAPAAATRAVVGDFDSDGDDDILYQTAGNGTAWQYARSNGDGTFTIMSQAASPFAGVTLDDHNGSNALAGDVDGDGDDDLIITANGTTGEVYFADGAPPVLVSSTPSDNGMGVAVGANIVLTFNEAVTKHAGNIYIYRGDGVLIETISVGSAQVTGSGTTWTIDPSVTLQGLTNYYILTDDGIFRDVDLSIFAGISDPTTLNFTTASSNTAPTFGNLNGDLSGFTEDAGAVRLDVGGNATVSDSDSANFDAGTLTVSITAGGVAAQDVLSIANIGNGAGQIGVSGGAVTYGGVQIGTVTGGTGGANLVVTFDADATPAAVQALVRALQYNNTSQAPSTADRTVTVVVTDGDGGTSATQTVTVGVTAVNDAPTASGSASLAAVAEDVADPAGDTVANMFGANFGDIDGHSLAGVMIGVNNANPSQGVWQVFTGGAWTTLPTLSPTNTYLVSASDSLRFLPAANYSGAPGGLIVLLIDNSAGAVVTGTRLDSSVTGSGGTTVYSSVTVSLSTSVTAANDAPTVVSGDTPTFTEGGAAVVVSANLALADVDSANMTGATISIADFVSGDVLTFVNQNGITGSYDSGTGILTLSGTASVANYQAALRSITYSNAGDADAGGTDNSRTVQFEVTDGAASSGVASAVISITTPGATPGDDTLGGTTANDTIDGLAGDDILDGGAGDDTLDGGEGEDTLIGGAGDDVLNGGDGLDTADYSGSPGGVHIRLNGGFGDDGHGGTDTLTGIENLIGSANNDILIGGAGVNMLAGGDGADVLLGLDGDDVLFGGAGAANQLQGGMGDDTYYVDANDTIVELAGQGHDRIFTSRSAMTLVANVEELHYTGSAAFTGVGNALDNTLVGNIGDDVLSGRGGNDTLDGGGGVDTASYASAASGVTANLLTGVVSNDGDGGSDTLIDIDNLIGSAFGDVLTGDAGANTLSGGASDDVLAGDAGDDLLQGGTGNDTVVYTSASSGTVVRLDLATAQDGLGGTDTLSSIENVRGSDFNDLLIGDAGANALSGEGGADILIGRDGDDILSGGSGAANTLYGGLGDDTFIVSANDTIHELAGQGVDTVRTDRAYFVLSANVEILEYTGVGDFAGVGNAEANVITGGAGRDTLTGGAGDDILYGEGGYDTAVFTGAASDYLIEHLGGGEYRVTDSVGGRDGVDLVNDIEQLRFSDGIMVLGAAPAPVLTAKEMMAEVSPLLDDDAFVLSKDMDLPQVLPEADDGFGATLLSSGPAALTGADMLAIDDAGLLLPAPDDHRGTHHHDDWLL